MNTEQTEYTVEYEDRYGVLYYANVKADNVDDAAMRLRQLYPDAVIRAVTRVPEDG
ncbi:hypothetical protein [Paenibacillus spongiae]|uniref:SPOR domain-containing protein n=1 Tax=Paenibacillus spongiae TaxID=2909671 RepID=A0ABY5SAC2_9BACL|nr:hypothetical protein [Paenibacillus spongiae]UVI29475.1 hypothetical protein L1F29_29330 [Paenibacillus spongiae]